MDPATNQLFVGSRDRQSIFVLDSETGEELARYQLSGPPFALAFNTDTRQLLAVDAVNDQLLVVDVDEGQQLGSLPLARQNADHGGQGLAVWDNFIYVASYEEGLLEVFSGGDCILPTPTPSVTTTPTPRATKISTKQPPTRTGTPTPRPSATPTPSATHTLNPTATFTATFTLIPTKTPSVTSTPTQSPTATPSPVIETQSVIAKIEIVWSHGGASVTEAQLANITAHLYEDELFNPVACDFEAPVRLWAAINNAPARPIATGKPRSVRDHGHTYRVWDFNDVDVSAANDPANKLNFFLTVDGYETLRNIWTHGADALTRAPGQDIPSATTTASRAAVDAKIEIVWPHGNAPVSEAKLANLSAFLFNKKSDVALAPGVSPQPHPRLHSSIDNGVNGGRAAAVLGQPRTVTQGDLTWLAYDFNDIDVSTARDPDHHIYFWVEVDGIATYPNIWTHGASGLTIAPEQDAPIRSCR